jgi:very-short-patch-repair endonuclease
MYKKKFKAKRKTNPKHQRLIIPYEDYLKDLAQNLRNNATDAEILLWNRLKGKKMMGYDFHLQKPLDKFIVDFYCCELMLAIEVDGDIHDWIEEEDLIRQRKLEAMGIRFLRFDDWDVKHDIEGVLNDIRDWIENNSNNMCFG